MAIGFGLFFGLWYLTTAVLALPRFERIPDPLSVLLQWASRNPTYGFSIFTADYYRHIGYSVYRAYTAFVLAVALGVPLGLLMGWSGLFRRFAFPVVELIRPIPPLAWVPFAILLLPGTEQAVIFVTFIAAFFATVLNSYLGACSIDPVYFRAAQCLGHRPREVFFHVVVPGALPFVFTGLQLGMGLSWFALVAGEMISGRYGLGFMIFEGYSLAQYPNIIIGMVTLGLLGYASSAGVRILGRRLMVWRERQFGGGDA
jgi:NitT/TauT family transport system permease protein